MITAVGDIHGKRQEYLEIIANNEHTVQIGDCDFNYDFLKEVDPAKHKIIPGNHDNHNIVYDDPHCLGRFGVHALNGIEFFFLAGAYSIDKQYRIEGKSWWPNEELSHKELVDAIDLYDKVRPKVVLSHECPSEIVRISFGINDNNITRNALRVMWEIHKPKLWIFGHWHRDFDQNILGTRFICLNELKTHEIQINYPN